MKLSALWIKEVGSSETYILIYQTAWHHIPEDMYLHNHYENVKSHKSLNFSNLTNDAKTEWLVHNVDTLRR
jgi:hypothetical protein